MTPDEHDAWHDLRQDENAQAQHLPEQPRPGSRQDAYDRGYNPEDWKD